MNDVVFVHIWTYLYIEHNVNKCEKQFLRSLMISSATLMSEQSDYISFKAKNQIFVILSLLQNQPKNAMTEQNCWFIRSGAKAGINVFLCSNQFDMMNTVHCYEVALWLQKF